MPARLLPLAVPLVQPTAHIHEPNAFSPDGDGSFDVFGPVGHDIYTLDMMISDRWGESIYQTTDMSKAWDGHVDGSAEIEHQGIYVYKLCATGRRFGPVELIGSVALIK